MKKLHLREKHSIGCGGITRSNYNRDSLTERITVEIEVYQNHPTNPTLVDSLVRCPHFTEKKKCAVSIDDTVEDKPQGGGNCKNYISFGELLKEADGFTTKGYNDRPKPCLEEGCDGLVIPTRVANGGICYKCDTITSWNKYALSRNKD